MANNHLPANQRDCLANARDFQADANTLRRQAARLRQPRKGSILAQAETLELQSAGWLASARIHRHASTDNKDLSDRPEGLAVTDCNMIDRTVRARRNTPEVRPCESQPEKT
jgi:hypothetical protein